MRASLSNIVKVPNFMSEEEIEYFLSYAQKCPIITDAAVTERSMLQIDGGDSPPNEMTEYLEKLRLTVQFHCGFHLVDLCGIALRKWMPGESQAAHADCEAVFHYNVSEWDMSPINNFSSLFIEYAALVYLNDDYEGGEIYFPEYGIDIKPRRGDLIFFPGTSLYTHGVREVKSGLRFTLMTFFTTPKLQYIWKYFVLDDSPVRTVERSEDDQMKRSYVVTKQNIPKSLETFGSNFPSKLDVEVLTRKIADEAVDMSIFGRSKDNIQVLENFLSKEDVEFIMNCTSSISRWNYCQDGPQDEWFEKTCGADILMTDHQRLYEVIEKYARKALRTMEEFYRCKIGYREPALVRWRAGLHSPSPHADKQNIDGTPKRGFEDWDVSAVMYLNEDFDGGELVFPQHGVSIKPKAGSLAFYPGDDAYIHYVNSLSSGTRWTIPMFFSFEKFDENEK